MAEIDRFLRFCVKSGSSDFHLSPRVAPMYRMDGHMTQVRDAEEHILSPEQTADLVGEILPDRNRAEFKEFSDTDFAYKIDDAGRFRVNVFRDQHGVGAVFRHIPEHIKSLEELTVS